MQLLTVPARRGLAIKVGQGRAFAVVNTHGGQVVDFWAFAADDLAEHLSMRHTRNAHYRLAPRPGDTLVSNRRRTMVTMVSDTSPGVHDTLIPCCDAVRYAQLGHPGHDNCADNMREALRALGFEPPEPPAPFNLFMNIPVAPDGALSAEAPVALPGDEVVFRAETPLVAVFSACPHDILPVNGPGGPTEAHIRLES
jgi:uncharacterized protein